MSVMILTVFALLPAQADLAVSVRFNGASLSHGLLIDEQHALVAGTQMLPGASPNTPDINTQVLTHVEIRLPDGGSARGSIDAGNRFDDVVRVRLHQPTAPVSLSVGELADVTPGETLQIQLPGARSIEVVAGPVHRHRFGTEVSWLQLLDAAAYSAGSLAVFTPAFAHRGALVTRANGQAIAWIRSVAGGKRPDEAPVAVALSHDLQSHSSATFIQGGEALTPAADLGAPLPLLSISDLLVVQPAHRMMPSLYVADATGARIMEASIYNQWIIDAVPDPTSLVQEPLPDAEGDVDNLTADLMAELPPVPQIPIYFESGQPDNLVFHRESPRALAEIPVEISILQTRSYANDDFRPDQLLMTPQGQLTAFDRQRQELVLLSKDLTLRARHRLDRALSQTSLMRAGHDITSPTRASLRGVADIVQIRATDEGWMVLLADRSIAELDAQFAVLGRVTLDGRVGFHDPDTVGLCVGERDVRFIGDQYIGVAIRPDGPLDRRSSGGGALGGSGLNLVSQHITCGWVQPQLGYVATMSPETNWQPEYTPDIIFREFAPTATHIQPQINTGTGAIQHWFGSNSPVSLAVFQYDFQPAPDGTYALNMPDILRLSTNQPEPHRLDMDGQLNTPALQVGQAVALSQSGADWLILDDQGRFAHVAADGETYVYRPQTPNQVHFTAMRWWEAPYTALAYDALSGSLHQVNFDLQLPFVEPAPFEGMEAEPGEPSDGDINTFSVFPGQFTPEDGAPMWDESVPEFEPQPAPMIDPFSIDPQPFAAWTSMAISPVTAGSRRDSLGLIRALGDVSGDLNQPRTWLLDVSNRRLSILKGISEVEQVFPAGEHTGTLFGADATMRNGSGVEVAIVSERSLRWWRQGALQQHDFAAEEVARWRQVALINQQAVLIDPVRRVIRPVLAGGRMLHEQQLKLSSLAEPAEAPLLDGLLASRHGQDLALYYPWTGELFSVTP